MGKKTILGVGTTVEDDASRDRRAAEQTPPVAGVSGIAQAGVDGLHIGDWPGVHGASRKGDGVFGQGGANGVHGRTSANANSGVWGENTGGGYGVAGSTASELGESAGVWGSNSGEGIGVKGTGGIGIFGQGPVAGRFEGDLEVTGVARVNGNVEVAGDVILQNADCAEEFDVDGRDIAEPGSVMVLSEGGAVCLSHAQYDRRVAGVVSGAGEYKPAIVLDRRCGVDRRVALALVGKVFCKVDASLGAIEIGDLLTTSPTPGHAMRATDHVQAFGAVLGKALRPWKTGQGVIPVLVALQ